MAITAIKNTIVIPSDVVEKMICSLGRICSLTEGINRFVKDHPQAPALSSAVKSVNISAPENLGARANIRNKPASPPSVLPGQLFCSCSANKIGNNGGRSSARNIIS